MGKNETKNYVGGSGMDDMELDERVIYSLWRRAEKKAKRSCL